MKSVVLLGGYPPPVGGNSVHIARLARELVADGYQCQVVDPYSSEPISPEDGLRVIRVGGKGFRSLLKAAWLIRKIAPDVVHMHVSAMEKFVYAGPILLLLIGRINKRVLTIHSGSFAKKFTDQIAVKRLFAVSFLKKFDSLITVNSDQKKTLVRYGCEDGRIRVIPAYIPPEVTESEELEALVEKTRHDKKTLLLTSGYGLPLYGYEKIVRALLADSGLAKKFRLVMCLYNTYDEDYIKTIIDSMSGLEDAIIFRGLSAGEFAYLLGQSSVYVRATDRDGDAVAIREAHSFGVSVVASSVVLRPDFCILFDRDVLGTLTSALWESTQKGEMVDSVLEDNFHKITMSY